MEQSRVDGRKGKKVACPAKNGEPPRQVKGLESGDMIEFREQKTGKLHRITLNKACIDTIQALLSSACWTLC